MHSDVPGSATWGRFEHVNWKVEVPVDGGMSTGNSARDASETTPKPSAVAGASANGTVKKKTTTKSSGASSASKAGGTSTSVPPSSEEDEQGAKQEGKVQYLDWRTDVSKPGPSSPSYSAPLLLKF